MPKQTEEEFKSHFKEQIEFLIRSASAYDEGFESEAKRMANVLRVLLYDTNGPMTSLLLSHLGKKDMKFYDTASDLVPGNPLPESTLIITKMQTGQGGKGTYVAPLDENFAKFIYGDRQLSFSDWWNKEVIKDDKNRKLTRKDIVLFVCHKDGGAHIDENLDDVYFDLTRNNSLGLKYFVSDNEGEVKGAELASIRQITHEVLKSIGDEFHEYSDLLNQYFQNLKPLLQ